MTTFTSKSATLDLVMVVMVGGAAIGGWFFAGFGAAAKVIILMLVGMIYIRAFLNEKEMYTGRAIIGPNDAPILRIALFILGLFLFLGAPLMMFLTSGWERSGTGG